MPAGPRSRDHDAFVNDVMEQAQRLEEVHKRIQVKQFLSREVFLMEFGFFEHRDSDGEPVAFMAFRTNLYNSQETEQLLDSIENAYCMGDWQPDLETGYVAWSERVYEIHKIPFGTPAEKITAINYYAPH